MYWLDVLTLLGGASLALVAVWTDVRCREVPNWIVSALVALWLVAVFFAPDTLGGAPLAGLACGLIALAFGMALFALGWLGGGDGKLLSALALWLGPSDIGLALLATAALGLLLTVPTLIRKTSEWRRQGIPYALAISPPAATLLAVRAVS